VVAEDRVGDRRKPPVERVVAAREFAARAGLVDVAEVEEAVRPLSDDVLRKRARRGAAVGPVTECEHDRLVHASCADDRGVAGRDARRDGDDGADGHCS
jgi:hypothetical protein